MNDIKIAVLGGSGLYQMAGMSDICETRVKTPFGDPSDTIITGTLGTTRIAFLPRHGKGHRINPSELPSRANIYALKTLGVERIISVSAVGSLKEKIKPRDLVVPDQIIDRTQGRANTYFSGGIVAHIGFAQPYCPSLGEALFQSGKKAGADIHMGGTCIVMEGPQFSTRAESNLYRAWGADIINMTNFPEARLAREAEICYATLAVVTDYDCWNESFGTVTTEMVVENLVKSTAVAKVIIRDVITSLGSERKCPCPSALKDAIITAPDLIPAKVKKDLKPIIGKYIK